MTVKDFVKASFMDMIFKDYNNHNVIYNFQWNDDIGENEFISEYGHCEVVRFNSHCDGIIDVYIESDV